MLKETIVISAVNLVEGGTLTILNNCLSFLNSNSLIRNKYRVVALVHGKEMFRFENIDFMELPLAKRNWLFRLYYEYIAFNKISKSLKPKLWLSLHDTSPAVTAERKAVYCHNPTPFYHVKLKQIRYSYKLYLFSVFYKYIYRMNIKSNDYVIVQQQWLREAFVEMYNLDKRKVIVSYPHELPRIPKAYISFPSSSPLFFFPSLSRPFKNFEVICKAADLLVQRGITNFKVVLTINGSEDLYSKEIVGTYKKNLNIDFCGRLLYSDVCGVYQKSTCLIFPSKLETWGLPISEFIQYRKPMILSDLPYAHEAASTAEKVVFFDHNDASRLSYLMEDVINDDLSQFKKVSPLPLNTPHTKSWEELFDLLLD